MGGPGRLPCISLQQPWKSSLPAWHLVLAASPGKGRAKASILPVLEKGKIRGPEPFVRAGGWPETGFHTHLILDCHTIPHFLLPRGPKVLKRADVNSHTGGCCRSRKHLRPYSFQSRDMASSILFHVTFKSRACKPSPELCAKVSRPWNRPVSFPSPGTPSLGAVVCFSLGLLTLSCQSSEQSPAQS